MSKIEFLKRLLFRHIKKYDHDSYWSMRKHVVDPESTLLKVIKYYYLYKIKKVDAFHNASFGTNIGSGAVFKTPPILAHGPNGIIIHPNARIGSNCVIYHQVTVAQGDGSAAKIGANCVVTKDVPDNCTIVGIPAKIIKINGSRVDRLIY